MTAIGLVTKLLAQVKTGVQIDWMTARKEIYEEHKKATTTEERVLLLSVHKAVMDAVERNLVEPGKMADFRNTRAQDYRLLLISEAIIGRTDGNIDPVRMAEITRREVDAGRLPPHDELHNLAIAGATVLGPMPERRTLRKKIRSWFRK